MKRLLGTVIAAAALLGAAPSSGGGASFNLGEWTVHTGAVDANQKSGNFTIPGHISMTRPTGDLNADSAKGNFSQKHVIMMGHVVLHDNRGGAFGDFGSGPTTGGGPSTLTTDQLDVDSLSKFYTATGNVHYIQGNRTIDAQKGTLNDNTKDLTLYTVHFVQGTQTVDATQGVLNDKTHLLDLTGKVHVVDADRKMDADHVIYNTQTGDLHARGNVIMRFPGGSEPTTTAPASKKKKKKLIPF